MAVNQIKKQDYAQDGKSILVADSLAFSLGAVIGNTSVTAGPDGRKIIKAGTPVAGNILKRNTAFTKGSDADAVAILLHDVDVTEGNANGTILVSGYVDYDKLDTDVQALVTNALVARLPKITFISGTKDVTLS